MSKIVVVCFFRLRKRLEKWKTQRVKINPEIFYIFFFLELYINKFFFHHTLHFTTFFSSSFSNPYLKCTLT